MAATLRTVRANGLEVACREFGKGPLVVLLHGFPDTAETWDDLAEKLATAGYRAVAPHLRGYHPTTIPADGDYSVAKLAADLVALIDELGERRAAVIGHDWGAAVGYAAANLAPDRISKLVALAIPHARTIKPTPGLLWRAPHFLLFQFGALSRWYVARNDLAYIDHLYAYWAPNWKVPREQLERVKAAFRLPGRLSAALGYYTALRTDGLDRVKQRLYRQKTSVPTLAIGGRADGALDPAAYAATPEAFTGPYEVELIDRAGHFPHREEPEVCARLILKFLGAPPA